MGFMDKVKESVKNVEEKVGNAIDCEKIDSKIREQEREIEKITAEIGKAVVADLKEGKEIVMTAIDELYAKITEAEKKIEDLKAEKEALKEKKERSPTGVGTHTRTRPKHLSPISAMAWRSDTVSIQPSISFFLNFIYGQTLPRADDNRKP